jgi:zinc-ribbon domain
MTAEVVCGSCGTRLRDNARFCDECGAPTAISADAAEYKQVQICGVQPLHVAEGLAGDFLWFEVQPPRTVAWDYARMKSTMNPVARKGDPRQPQSSSDSWMPAINPGCRLDSTNVR